MYLYTAYGLGILSELALPELRVAEQASDVSIRLENSDSSVQEAVKGKNCFRGGTENVGNFLVQDGREIVIYPSLGVDEALLRTLVLGPIFSVLLRQRGLLVLHASSIAIQGSSIAFLGGSGWGKSTLAEAFYRRGHGIVSDDVMAVQIGTNHPHVLPSYPHIKLLPDAAGSLQGEEPIQLHAQTEKCSYPVPYGFPHLPLPLQRLYVLAVGTRNKIEPLSPQAALVELVRHSRAVSLLKSPDFVSAHLRQCAELVKEVPICRLTRQPSLSGLADVAQLIEEDLASHRSADGRILSP